MKKIAIIGAGASGLLTSILTKQNNPNIQIDIFETNDKIGKKILASGNGRCNITNLKISYQNYMSENMNFVKTVLDNYSYTDDENIFNSLGLNLMANEKGKVYPFSNDAKSVVNILGEYLNLLSINTYLSCKITDIKKIKNKFVLSTLDTKYTNYDKVVISTGLLAAPQLNGCNDGVVFANKFGHKSIQNYPSLVGLHLDGSIHTKFTGIKNKTKISLLVNGKQIEEVYEDVLFTKYGVSGFGILDISQVSVYNLVRNKKVELSLNFMPWSSKNELYIKLSNIIKERKEQTFSSILYGFLAVKFVNAILKHLNIDLDLKCRAVSLNDINILCETLFCWKFKVIETKGYKHAEVCGGGIDTKDINPNTLESKLSKGLYLAGEVMDVVGNRGGYNLHFAWVCGMILSQQL